MDGSGGCYGFAIHGAGEARSLLVDAPSDWPGVTLDTIVGGNGGGPAHDVVGDDAAELPLHRRGWMHVTRQDRTVRLHVPDRVRHEELVHPYLAPGAAILARWCGRESFHAGAVLVDGGAWAILGDRESGKSSTLAWLALHGHDVLADDLLVVDGDDVLAGPRCIDLRPDAARRFDAGEPLGVVGSRERWRLRVSAVPPRVPLRGWVQLRWSEGDVAVRRLQGPDRLLALIPHRSVRLAPPRAEVLMDLASRPVLVLERPRSWDALPEAMRVLLAAMGA